MLDQAEICKRLDVDAYGLERLIGEEGLAVSGPAGARMIEPESLSAFVQHYKARQDSAIKTLSAMDRPHF